MSIEAKQKDENYVQYTVSDVRNCDKGYSVYFTDSPPVKESRIGERLTYWLDEKYGFIPRPGDLMRFYGKLEPGNKTIYGADVIRFDKDEDSDKPQRVRTELFYDEELKEKLYPKKDDKKDDKKKKDAE